MRAPSPSSISPVAPVTSASIGTIATSRAARGDDATQSVRASTVAGAAITAVAGVALGTLALCDRPAIEIPVSHVVQPALGRPASTPADSPLPTVESLRTSNLHARPDQRSEAVAVLPGGQQTAVLGRSQDGDWVLVTTPTAAGPRGWVPAAVLRIDAGMLPALPVLDGVVIAAPTIMTAEALPDPALTEASLLSGGQLTVGIANLSQGVLHETALTLRVTSARTEADGGDEVIGVFRIGPATLPAGSHVAIVVPLTIHAAGNYRLELDPDREVPDVRPSNNVLEVVLTPGRN